MSHPENLRSCTYPRALLRLSSAFRLPLSEIEKRLLPIWNQVAGTGRDLCDIYETSVERAYSVIQNEVASGVIQPEKCQPKTVRETVHWISSDLPPLLANFPTGREVKTDIASRLPVPPRSQRRRSR